MKKLERIKTEMRIPQGCISYSYLILHMKPSGIRITQIPWEEERNGIHYLLKLNLIGK